MYIRPEPIIDWSKSIATKDQRLQTHVLGKPAERGPLFREFLGQKLTHTGGTYPYHQLAVYRPRDNCCCWNSKEQLRHILLLLLITLKTKIRICHASRLNKCRLRSQRTKSVQRMQCAALTDFCYCYFAFLFIPDKENHLSPHAGFSPSPKKGIEISGISPVSHWMFSLQIFRVKLIESGISATVFVLFWDDSFLKISVNVETTSLI